MKNKSISELVAADMNARLQSEEHLALFNGVYKLAGEKCSKCNCAPCACDSAMADDNDAKKKKKCEKCDASPCKCDSSKADDNDARKKKKEDSKKEDSKKEDSNSAFDVNNAIWTQDNAAADDDDSDDESDADDDSSDESDADDDNNDVDASASAGTHSNLDALDKGRYDTNEERYGNVTASLDEAFAHLLNASALLDAVGFEKSAALSLNLAGFLVEAKKKVKDKKKKKKDSKSKSSGKSNSSSKSSKDSNDARAKKKKEDSKPSSSKPNPFAKKK